RPELWSALPGAGSASLMTDSGSGIGGSGAGSGGSGVGGPGAGCGGAGTSAGREIRVMIVCWGYPRGSLPTVTPGGWPRRVRAVEAASSRGGGTGDEMHKSQRQLECPAVGSHLAGAAAISSESGGDRSAHDWVTHIRTWHESPRHQP